uniref:Small integral membrane protein 20 n=2 Tax=Amphimedon queenslandica TaxID=400682 RepID=A0A1X7VPG4_AMPQE
MGVVKWEGCSTCFMPSNRTLKNAGLAAGFLTLLGAALYSVIIYPKLHPEIYREKQKWIRDKVPLEKTQPGGMKVWTDPFGRKDSKK